MGRLQRSAISWRHSHNLNVIIVSIIQRDSIVRFTILITSYIAPMTHQDKEDEEMEGDGVVGSEVEDNEDGEEGEEDEEENEVEEEEKEEEEIDSDDDEEFLIDRLASRNEDPNWAHMLARDEIDEGNAIELVSRALGGDDFVRTAKKLATS